MTVFFSSTQKQSVHSYLYVENSKGCIFVSGIWTCSFFSGRKKDSHYANESTTCTYQSVSSLPLVQSAPCRTADCVVLGQCMVMSDSLLPWHHPFWRWRGTQIWEPWGTWCICKLVCTWRMTKQITKSSGDQHACTQTCECFVPSGVCEAKLACAQNHRRRHSLTNRNVKLSQGDLE
jgi:hypothetical protein